jgi:type II secretory ATPase GspE/PulE/Tfp pilus assembly ATPase PilB-like protein
MVGAQLLTYRLDVPQEGRLSVELDDGRRIDMRIAIMPTTHGLRAVVRLPADLLQPRTLDDLLLPRRVMEALHRFAAADAGLLLLCGPAGSGKTTAIYALLEHIVATSPGVSVVALEDPVERDLRGVTQIEVSPFGELTYERALRSMLRQDPQVLALGEVRDAATASVAIQAALSGHRLVSTLHASTPQGALVRLTEMGIEPYQIASSVFGIAAVRLLRRVDGRGDYAGRVPIAEYAAMDEAVREAVLSRADASRIRRAIEGQAGFTPLAEVAADLVGQGITDRAEVARVLGPAGESGGAPCR